MADDSRVVFVDTNVFIHVRDLKDVSWRDLFPNVRAIDIMVAPRVIEELDKHKVSTNQRRRARARLALSLIDKASLEPGLALTLRAVPIQVRLIISKATPFDWTTHPILDPTKPDDQLVAEAMSFGNGAEILSHDSGPRIRARIGNMQAHEPCESWLLPIEQTDDQRKITKLERDLELALSTKPRIIVGFDHIDESTSEIQVVVPILQPLDGVVAFNMAGDYLAAHPRSSYQATSNRLGLQLGGLSEPAIRQYQSEYAEFESKVRAFYASLHESVALMGMAAAVGYFVKNENGVAADGLRIEFDLEGKASLLAEREDAEQYIGSLEMPEEPDEPRSSLDYLRTPLTGITTLHDAMQPRDPVGFYWFERPKLASKHSALQCQEFRAMREFRDSIFILGSDSYPLRLGLQLHVSAANLPEPIYVPSTLVVAKKPVS